MADLATMLCRACPGPCLDGCCSLAASNHAYGKQHTMLHAVWGTRWSEVGCYVDQLLWEARACGTTGGKTSRSGTSRVQRL
jgi:hypothetical protein